MCGGQHLVGQCHVVEDYIHAGQIAPRDRYLAYPDSSCIRCHHGTGLLCTTIDEHYGNALPVQATTSDVSPSPSTFGHDPLLEYMTYNRSVHTQYTRYTVYRLPTSLCIYSIEFELSPSCRRRRSDPHGRVSTNTNSTLTDLLLICSLQSSCPVVSPQVSLVVSWNIAPLLAAS